MLCWFTWKLTFENVDPMERMDKSDHLDFGGPGRVGESGPNRSEAEPKDKLDALDCGGPGRVGESGLNTSDTEPTDKLDVLDWGRPGLVGESGPNISETEPSDKSDILCCGGLGRGEVGGEPASGKSKPVEKSHQRKKIKTKTNHLNQNRILKGLDSFKYSIYCVKKCYWGCFYKIGYFIKNFNFTSFSQLAITQNKNGIASLSSFFKTRHCSVYAHKSRVK